MIVPYTKNGNCYVLTNFAAANNPIFMHEEEVENFKQRLDKHLKGLCEILGYSFHSDHYQIIVVLKDRSFFEQFYLEKMKEKDMEPVNPIPASTYILSQEMANIQAGYAKWFNFKHGRYGSVFGRRYRKILIKDEEELKSWLELMNGNKVLWEFEDFWSYVKNFIKRLKHLRAVGVCSGWLYAEGCLVDPILSIFLPLEQFLLRGHYIARDIEMHHFP